MNTLKKSVCFLLYLAALCQFSHGDLISDVCAKSQNAAFCEKALRADPRAPKADLKRLGQISIDISKTSAKSGLTLVTKLLNEAKDNVSKEIYKTCVVNYGDAVSDLDSCTASLRAGDFATLNVNAAAAMTEPDTCDDGFKDDGSLAANLPKEPAELIAQSRNLQGLCSIILAISVLLKGK